VCGHNLEDKAGEPENNHNQHNNTHPHNHHNNTHPHNHRNNTHPHNNNRKDTTQKKKLPEKKLKDTDQKG
jgi:hypothetical protein